MAVYVDQGEEQIDLLGVVLTLGVHKMFLGFLIGNFTFTIGFAAFFRMVVFEKLTYAATDASSEGQRQVLRRAACTSPIYCWRPIYAKWAPGRGFDA